MDVVNVENAGAFFHQLNYIHAENQREWVTVRPKPAKGLVQRFLKPVMLYRSEFAYSIQ